MVRCEHCQLDNAEGALYCARCHKALPRLLAPGECRYCGFIPDVAGRIADVCPSCGNDAERGKDIRQKRAARLLAEVEIELQKQPKTPPARRKRGTWLSFGSD